MPRPYLPALRTASALYIALPWVPFLASWARPAWAVVGIAVLGGTVVAYLRTARAAPGDERLTSGALAAIVLIAVAWVSLSGAGGVGFQNRPDWDNKNVLLSELLRQDWPVVYENGRVLNYYFGLYLPAAVVGRLAGWNAAQWSLYGTVCVGTVLSLLWVRAFAGRLGTRAALLFLVFGGLDVVGYVLLKHDLPPTGAMIEWWATGVQFSSGTTLLFWVPQHALAGWLLTSLILDEATRLGRVAFAGLFVALCYLWSPFVALGLVPVAVAAWLLSDRASARSAANLVCFPVTTVLAAAFYAPHREGGDLGAGAQVWAQHFAPDFLLRLALFLVLEVGVYLACVALVWRHLDRRWRALAVTVAVASVLWTLTPEPVGHGGFTMRSSIPSLLVLFLLVMHVLSLPNEAREGRVRLARLGLAGCLALGAVTSLEEVTRSVKRYPATIPPARPTVTALQMTKRHTGEFIMPMDSPVYRFFYRIP